MELSEFLAKHSLPEQYLNTIQEYFEPLATSIYKLHKVKERPIAIGVNGSQGSGKTTLCDYLKYSLESKSLNVIELSIDDFYLSKADRLTLSENVHPLFKTRGVPGTHDTSLLRKVLTESLNGVPSIKIPRFDKSIDDQVPNSEWVSTVGKLDVVLLEGWCWGARHERGETLSNSCNALEQEEDQDLIWRRRVNEQLRNEYEPLYGMMDAWVMLKAPSFEVVYEWRLEQEKKLSKSTGLPMDGTNQLMSPEQLIRFINHYQRVTETILDHLPKRADLVFEMNQKRQIEKQLSNTSVLTL